MGSVVGCWRPMQSAMGLDVLILLAAVFCYVLKTVTVTGGFSKILTGKKK